MPGHAIRFAAAFALCALLAGCADGVEVNSKLLDAVGSNLVGSKSEKRMTERPGLVVPPPMAALPEPGDKTAAALAAGLPVDPESAAKSGKAQEKAAKLQACETAKLKKDSAAVAENCEGLLSKIWNSQNSSDEE